MTLVSEHMCMSSLVSFGYAIILFQMPFFVAGVACVVGGL